MSACTCAAFIMMIVVNGIPQRPIDFNTKEACTKAKPVYMRLADPSLRSQTKLECVPK